MHGQLFLDAIRVLAGHQVTDVEDFYNRIGGERRAEDMPVEVRRGLGRLLGDLGYRQRWVCGLDGGRTGFRWVRSPWPIDVEAIRGREVETYARFD